MRKDFFLDCFDQKVVVHNSYILDVLPHVQKQNVLTNEYVMYKVILFIISYRYYNPGVYEKLLYTKRIWDPYNKFNHCQSIGNESCCPV